MIYAADGGRKSGKMREISGAWPKNQLQISLEKYIFSERRDFHLSENIYIPSFICNWFLVTLHWFPVFSRVFDRHLQHKSRPRSQLLFLNYLDQKAFQTARITCVQN